MSTENEDASALEQARFRAMIVAMHPDKAKEILDILDSSAPNDPNGIPEFAPELADEEMETYEPFSVDEVSQTIELMRRFGMAVQG